MGALPSTISVAVQTNFADTTLHLTQVPWPDLVAEFSEHVRGECTRATCAGKKCARKDTYNFLPVVAKPGAKRTDPDVEALTLACYDLDGEAHAGLTAEHVEALERGLQGIAALLYTTHTSLHESTGRWCLRVVLPLTRPVPAAQWRPFYHALARMAELPSYDRTCENESRLFYFPSCPSDAKGVTIALEGEAVDVDAVLAEVAATGTIAPNESPGKPAAVPVAPTPTESAPVDLDVIRERLRAVKTASKELARVIVDGKPLAPRGEHDNTMNRAAALITRVASEYEPEALLEVLRPSLVAMGWEDGADHCLEQALKKLRRKLPSARARKAAEEATARAVEAYADSRKQSSRGPETDEAAEDDEAWKALLIPRIDGRTGEVVGSKLCGNNLAVVLKHHPAWRGRVRYNELTGDVDLSPGVPVQTERRTRDAVVSSIAHWFERTFQDDQWVVTESVLQPALLQSAQELPFDPLTDYLNGLHWDGVPRLDTWLEKYCAAVTVGPEGDDRTEYVRKVGRRWLISAAARGLRPGTKVDQVLILQGAQGVGKTTLASVLGGEWFSNSTINVEHKDTAIAMSSRWIVELGELTSLLKTDDESLKNFLTQQEVYVRRPYARTPETLPRRSVFLGTTNAQTFLRDQTGNRRYWVVSVGEVDTVALARDRDQLFAEAVAVVRSRADCQECAASGVEQACHVHRWWMGRDEREAAARATEDRVSDAEPIRDAVWNWWHRMAPEKRPREIRTIDVAQAILRSDMPVRAQQMAIAEALRQIGFRPKRASKNAPRCYTPTEALRMAPRDIPPGSLLAQAGAQVHASA